jgi:hypothetical protein
MTNYKIDRGVPIPKANLHPNPWNPNHMKPRQQTAVEESIKAYGQVLELLVRPHPEIDGEYQIIDGEHRFNVLPDTVYCNVIHGLPDAEAKKLTIVMNETRGSADKIELAQLLAEISTDIDDLLTGLPYEESELNELIALADVDWDNFTDDFDTEPDADQHDPTEDGYITLYAKVTPESMDIINQAADLIRDQRLKLDDDKAIAWGQILDAIAKDFLSMPRSNS